MIKNSLTCPNKEKSYIDSQCEPYSASVTLCQTWFWWINIEKTKKMAGSDWEDKVTLLLLLL